MRPKIVALDLWGGTGRPWSSGRPLPSGGPRPRSGCGSCLLLSFDIVCLLCFNADCGIGPYSTPDPHPDLTEAIQLGPDLPQHGPRFRGHCFPRFSVRIRVTSTA